jgi:hypothetical protein
LPDSHLFPPEILSLTSSNLNQMNGLPDRHGLARDVLRLSL